MKPLANVDTIWSPELAYAVGLIATDGSLSVDGRHIVFVSKDIEQINTFRKCLGIKNKIGLKSSGFIRERRYYYVAFGDVLFYKWLTGIGLTSNKTKTIGAIKVPDCYFFDFLRGHFDGDGSCYSYWDQRWASSFMFYIAFSSASKKHIEWMREKIKTLLRIKGHITQAGNKREWQLKYSKQESKILISKIYYKESLPRLKRKYKKIKNILKVDNEEIERTLKFNGRVLELADSLD